MGATLAAGGVSVAAAAAGARDPVRSRFVQAPALPGARAISSRDRVYAADQSSNAVSVIEPKAGRVPDTIALGQDRPDQVLGPDESQVNVHGLGFSRDCRSLDLISVTSSAAQLISTRDSDPRYDPRGTGGRQRLGRQGLGRRVETMPVEVRGADEQATETAHSSVPFRPDDKGGVDEGLAFTDLRRLRAGSCCCPRTSVPRRCASGLWRLNHLAADERTRRKHDHTNGRQ